MTASTDPTCLLCRKATCRLCRGRGFRRLLRTDEYRVTSSGGLEFRVEEVPCSGCATACRCRPCPCCGDGRIDTLACANCEGAGVIERRDEG